MAEEEIIKQVVNQVLARMGQKNNDVRDNPKMSAENRKIICNYSNRHCHISRKDLDLLYGPGYELTKIKDLIQPGEFASKEFVTIVGPTGETLPVRILGPIRSKTQVEISRSDSFHLKIPNVPVRESGKIEGTPGAVLAGPLGAVTLKEGVIIAWRHVHFTPEDAKYFGVSDRDMLKVRVETPRRSLIFEQVVARVKPTYALEMHIDVDEANAAGAGQGSEAIIIKD